MKVLDRRFLFAGACGLVLLVPGIASASSSGNVCKSTAQAASSSCKLGAGDDYWQATGKCLNVTDAALSQSCLADATDEKTSALDDCKAQLDARNGICDRLGPAAYDPPIDPRDFVSGVDNPLYPLPPGAIWVYVTNTADGVERNVVEVTRQTREILGVVCVEVHDAVYLDGSLSEDTLDWFAQDRRGNVWYFGENSKSLEGGLVVSVDGTWQAGANGASPGIVMKASPRVGDIYRQEFSLGDAEDMGEVLSLSQSVSVPFGSFSGLLMTRDFSALEPDAIENKFYAPGIGNILEIDLQTGDRTELVSFRH